MKILYLILPILFFSCSTSKAIDAPKEEMSKQEELNVENMNDASDYTCNIEIIKNLMPSADPSPFMYAIVTLLPHSGKLERNWKVITFEIEGNNYSAFDESEFTGKDLLIYRNNVREIPKDITTPSSAKVVFENDKGIRIAYDLTIHEIFEVH